MYSASGYFCTYFSMKWIGCTSTSRLKILRSNVGSRLIAGGNWYESENLNSTSPWREPESEGTEKLVTCWFPQCLKG